MRRIFLILLCLVVFAGSCSKKAPAPIILGETYTGTFQRQTSAGGKISNVTITFSKNTWTGTSQFEKYPALCRGTFKINDTDNITFQNDCPWTAEFDWTLILAQDYKIKITDKTIEITRDYNGAFKDIYKLTKQ